MRRIELCLLVSGVLALSACGSSGNGPNVKDGSAGKDGGAGTDAEGSDGAAGATDAPVDMAPTDGGGDTATDGSMDAVVLSAEANRGQYLVSVLGCSGCHTPTKNGAPDPTMFLAGRDCFAGSTSGADCLSSANLRNDASGIKDLTDQQVIDALRKGMFPQQADAGAQYLFSNMPYYQFAALTDADAAAIVEYLRELPALPHTVAPNKGAYATRPTAAQWTAVSYADLPNATVPTADAGAADAGAADAGLVPNLSNGKYFGALLCVTCHTVNTAATTPPFALDEAKAYQGGKKANTTITLPPDGGTDAGTSVTKEIESANLTPDMTGLKTWTIEQITTAIIQGKDQDGRTLCSPMRAVPALGSQDVTDIAGYLKGIPPRVNAITETCQ